MTRRASFEAHARRNSQPAGEHPQDRLGEPPGDRRTDQADLERLGELLET